MEYKKNDIVTVRIDDIGNDGEGIGKIDGYTLFVKDAVIGDVIEAKITKVKKNYGYARTEKVITPSPFRIEPKCAFHRQCGGCQIQAMSYERQLIFKQDKIKNNLIRIGGFAEEFVDKVMEPIVGMEEPWHYRNKAQYPVGYDKNGNLVTGFYAGRTHDIIPNTDCALGATENKLILETVLSYMRENHITAYNEKLGEGLLRHILIRTGFASGEIMVCLVINGRKLPGEKELIKKLTEINFEKQDSKGITKKIVSISVSINTERTNVIMGKEIRTIWGRSYIEDSLRIMRCMRADAAQECANTNTQQECIGANVSQKYVGADVSKELFVPEFEPTGESVTFHISPLSFYQVNPTQTEKLYSLALDYAGLTGKETVWDLYCGIGTISLFLAKAAGYVYGVEVIPQAIEDARENARINGITNAEFYVGEAEKILPDMYEKKGIHADIIVVDPPRKGCDGKCLETMLAMKPDRIVYISCDSATLARDLGILADGGYELARVRGVDQFSQGVHTECVCQLVKRSTAGRIAEQGAKRKINYREEEIPDCGCIYG